MELLRFATAGSVDDGKSTLIGRLLYDSKAIFEDQLEAVERLEPPAGRRVHGPRPSHRRAAGRTRAGHHHRRRLPLLRHAAAQVHHRRHPGAHPVHAQHGDGELDRGSHPGAGRRPQGDRGADQAPCLPGLAPAGAASAGVRQQDGPRRLRRGGLRRGSARSSRPSPPASRSPTSPSSPSRPSTATTWCSGRSTCPGSKARRSCTTSSRCTSPPTATSSTPGCPCSGWSGPRRPQSRTSAATPGGWRVGSSAPGTRSWCCPRG